ncbi:hypothetical protein I305_00401 [Cryptococcus gattii E566]|uniref:Uncharacterized protein n=2 Tax=Cryptococcus gattii TaxID=37769 RepID=E6QYI4_CRYGW|nr:Hypothetical Protein CGB_A8180W [Cryptococcus gattii WM276]ADV19897.1 Hypothetical Protein CGB_A8180W [Cryptococcus gattii WM276]KIR79494.1 hypothetical protein I306_03478 [Cryptococcus gattii EJB2]KIY37305.1 hypothetical protein I305_00401 [Cryptococcus gattii E566]KJE01227.1 hypothetical protein I311_05197 [Cryptococcus gattii NT-10]
MGHSDIWSSQALVCGRECGGRQQVEEGTVQGPGRTVRREDISGGAKNRRPPEVGHLPLGMRRQLLSPHLFLTTHTTTVNYVAFLMAFKKITKKEFEMT